MNTLALGYVIPAIRAYSGLAPVRQCSCRAYYQKGVAFVGMRHLFGCFSIKILLFLWYFTKNDYAEFVSFCATSVDWKSLHFVGEQPSFVLKIR